MFVGIGETKVKDPKAHPHDPRSLVTDWSNGITKRELFAAMALQGLMSNSGYLDAIAAVIKEDGLVAREAVAKLAVGAADALIEELKK